VVPGGFHCRVPISRFRAAGCRSSYNGGVWPIELYGYEESGMIAAWCESRNDFRNFRIDRVQSLHILERYAVRRQTLLAKWQLLQDEDPFY